MLHEFSRTELLIGKEALEKLAASTVAVFGIGGVGSFSVEALVRSGVGRLVLIDDDCVGLTNLNRQLIATHESIGRPKVEVMRDRIAAINPRTEVVIHQSFYLPESAPQLLSSEYDYIIDAVDTVTAKIDLVVNAQRLKIPIISCMGAGNKLDPTRFEIADIYATSVCPLAKVMRRELRKRGITELKVVYSREVPLQPRESEESGAHNVCIAQPDLMVPSQNSRRSIPGSMAFVASVAGLIMAGEVVKDLIRSSS
ncbi:MAG: tRNA threonylcarbamoyladenosine dehydratase [Firmicutes bacterium]|nr:tRNA threonylcarbamoyladenosine dehydratase [Bacillota bacterium]